MATQIIELGNSDSIVLTQDGKVVGLVTVKARRTHGIDLVGRPVHMDIYYGEPYSRVVNGFGCSTAITTDDVEEIDNPLIFAREWEGINA